MVPGRRLEPRILLPVVTACRGSWALAEPADGMRSPLRAGELCCLALTPLSKTPVGRGDVLGVSVLPVSQVQGLLLNRPGGLVIEGRDPRCPCARRQQESPVDEKPLGHPVGWELRRRRGTGQPFQTLAADAEKRQDGNS